MPGEVALRPMRWWDLDAVLAVEQEAFGPSAWTAETFWAELAHPQTRWYVVAEELDGRDGLDGPGGAGLLGYAGLCLPGAEADVQTIAVTGGARGRGLGGVLIDALIGQAHGRGATSLLLEVRADNAVAIGLYESRGFERIAIRRRYYQPEDVDAWVMRLRPLGLKSAG